MVSRDADSRHVRSLVTAEPPTDLDRPHPVGWLQRLCRAAGRHLPADGVGVSLLSEDGELMTATAGTPQSVRLEQLQFSLGEGPCLLAHATRAPVLVPDLAEMAGGLWPGYARAAAAEGVLAVFAFPLQIGAVRLGALDVYRDRVGSLSARALSQALTFATLAVEALLDASTTSAGTASLVDDGRAVPFEVYQAQGMVMAQLGVGGVEAMARLRARAFAEGRSLSDVADDVLRRRLVLEKDDP